VDVRQHGDSHGGQRSRAFDGRPTALRLSVLAGSPRAWFAQVGDTDGPS
jgi:hypothetical protein